MEVTLTIENFQAIKKLVLEIDGNMIIKGYHDSCKTSIINAITWLFFNTDNEGSAGFQPKPIDPNGDFYDVTTLVRLSYKDKSFTKTMISKRDNDGSITGNSIKYEVDDISSSKTVFDKEIEHYFFPDLSLVSRNIKGGALSILKMIASPYLFINLPTSERRNILLEMARVQDRSIIIESFENSNSEYSENLINFLKENSNKDLFELSKNIRTQINKSKEKTEFNNNLISKLANDVTNEDFSSKKEEIKNLNKKEIEIRERIQQGYNSSINKKIDESIAQKQRISTEIKIKENEISLLSVKKDALMTKESLNKITEQIKSKIGDLTTRRSDLRERLNEIKSSEFSGENCPNCNNELSGELLDKAKKKFLEIKTKDYNNVVSSGKETNSQIEELEERIKELTNNFNEDSLKRVDLEIELAKKENELNELKEQYLNIIVPEKEVLDASLLEKEIIEIRTSIELINKDLERETISNHAKEKIKEAEKEIAESRVFAMELQSKINILNAYNKFEINSIQESVDNLFDTVKFVLFKENLTNDNIEMICEPSINSTPYNNLNGRSRIVVLVEIAKALETYYKTGFVTVIDKRESGYDVVCDTKLSLMVQATDSFSPNININTLTGIKQIEISKV